MTPELDVDGPAAPPRRNGELAFDVPWQGRLFALTMALCDAGRLAYPTFRDELIAQIGRRDRDRQRAPEVIDEPGEYWAAWQDALERLLFTSGAVDHSELTARAHRFAEHD